MLRIAGHCLLSLHLLLYEEMCHVGIRRCTNNDRHEPELQCFELDFTPSGDALLKLSFSGNLAIDWSAKLVSIPRALIRAP